MPVRESSVGDKEAASRYSTEFRHFYSVMRIYIKRVDSPYSYAVWFQKFLKFFQGKKIKGKTVEQHWLEIALYAPYKRFFGGSRPHWWIAALSYKTHTRSNWNNGLDYKKFRAYLNNLLDLFVRSLPGTY